MAATLKFPFYARMSLLLIGLYVFFSMLSIGQALLLPLIYATIIAVLISPVVDFMVRKKINRALSISAVLFVSLLILTTLIALTVSQVSLLKASMPDLVDKFQGLLNQAITWASGYFRISAREINEWISHSGQEFIDSSGSKIGITLSSMGVVLAAIFLIPVYIFMILYYQPHLVRFVHKLFGAGNNEQVSEMLFETKSIIQGYLVGLFIQFAIVASLNSIGLLAIGIEYAILLGIAGALLNIIPYVGGLMAVTLFVIFTLVTKSPVYLLYVIGLYILIQFIDNNFIVPKVIGAKVKLNALVSIVAVISGAALWGIHGMFLSIPLIAIVKLVLDRTESLHAWGFLLGDTMPPIIKIRE
jgi:predicted PurR-regulated permease PerM